MSLILLSRVGLLWLLPVPDAFLALRFVANWTVPVVLVSLPYYVWLSWPLALGMLFGVVTILAVITWLESLAAPLWLLAQPTGD